MFKVDREDTWSLSKAADAKNYAVVKDQLEAQEKRKPNISTFLNHKQVC